MGIRDRRSIVGLGMVKEVAQAGGNVRVMIALTTPGCPLKNEINTRVRTAAMELPGVEAVQVDFTAMTPDELVAAALAARERAYAPYSNYRVGAALLLANGHVVPGCNVENAAYPSTICAERVALTAAVAQGERDFVAIAVATANGGSPCGNCRQVMAELGPDMTVYISDAAGAYRTTTVSQLLPDSFGPSKLI